MADQQYWSESTITRQQPADWLDVPSEHVVSLEHPCIVNNIDKGLKSIGGEHNVKHVGFS